MTKEIKAMMQFANEKKTLKINGAFTLEALTVDNIGRAMIMSSSEPAEVKLTLVYTLAHDKMLGMSRDVSAETVEQVIENIDKAMGEMLDEIKAKLMKQFKNGYLLGK